MLVITPKADKPLGAYKLTIDSADSQALGFNHCNKAPRKKLGRKPLLLFMRPSAHHNNQASHNKKTAPPKRKPVNISGWALISDCKPSPLSNTSKQNPVVAPNTKRSPCDSGALTPALIANKFTGPGDAAVTKAKINTEPNHDNVIVTTCLIKNTV